MFYIIKKRPFFYTYFILMFSISSPISADEKAWYENTEINGDVRLRYEGIYKKPGQDTDRERFR